MIKTKLNIDKTYSSKLILFGEYTVLFGGDALAIPYEKFYCKWESGRVFDHQNLGHHITEVVEKYSFLKFDFSHWFELTKNHFIKTNIPIGYGLGSSGAVVAAIFDLFFSIESFKNDFTLLKIFLGEIESYFHGKSSGIDPLVCLLNKPILIKENSIQLVNLDQEVFDQIKLIDSEVTRKNKNAINEIIEKYQEDPTFQAACIELRKTNDEVIALYLEGGLEKARPLIKEISKMQLQHFGQLIPLHLIDKWEEGLSNDKWYLKLCGGGGGGYYYCFENKNNI